MSDEALLQEANDPNTPSKKLAELTSAYDVTLARAAMRNPNLPRESLFSMAHKYPREFVENPALPLFLLEKSDPNELKAKTIKAIAQQPGIEHDIIETLLSICSDAMQAQIASSKVPERTLRFLMRAGSEKVRRAVAENANAGALLQELSTDEALQLSVAKNQSASLELLDTLSYLGEHIQMGVAQNPKTTTNILVRLADVSSTSTRRLVARHPNTPPESLTLLSNDSAQSVVEEVAKNPNTPLNVVALLSKDERQHIRRAVTENPGAPAALLVELATDKANWVVEGAFRHPNTPAAVLRRLTITGDESSSSHVAASINPNAPPDLLERLSTLKSDQILVNVASHRNTPLYVLAALYKNDSYRVQGAIPQEKRELLHLLSVDPVLRRAALLDSTKYTPELLSFFARDESPEVRCLAASHPDTSPEILSALSSDEHYRVLQGVAKHPKTPLKTLEKIFTQKNTDALQGLAENPNAPLSYLEALAQDTDLYCQEHVARHPSITSEIIEVLAKNGDYYALCALAQREDIPTHCLRLLATNAADSVKRLVAEHPKTPEDVLDILSLAQEAKEVVAARPGLPGFIVSRLLQSDEMGVLTALANNEDLTPNLYQELSRQSNVRVRCELLLNKNVPHEIKQGIEVGTSIKREMASHKKLPPDELQKLSQESDPEILANLATQKNIPEDVLLRLMSVDAPEIRLKLAQYYPSPLCAVYLAGAPEREARADILYRDDIPLQALLLLAKDKETSIRLRVSQRHELPREVALLLLHDTPEIRRGLAMRQTTSGDVLALLMDGDDIYLRCHLAAHPNATPEMLRWLSTDPDLFVQRLVAENWNAPPDLLVDHPNAFVRLGVLTNPKTPDCVCVKIPQEQADMQASLLQRRRQQEFLSLTRGL